VRPTIKRSAPERRIGNVTEGYRAMNEHEALEVLIGS
jgi:hypothetical protein